MNILKNLKPGYIIFSELLKVKKARSEAKEAIARGDHEAAKAAMLEGSKIWSQDLARRFGAKVNVIGHDNLPTEGPAYFVANHQGFADIPALYFAIDTVQAGFIAKDDIAKVPLYGPWIMDFGGIYLERDNPRAAVKTFQKAEDMMDLGYSYIIFPEGTRSKGGPMGEFKKGALKPAIRKEVPIIPITITGTSKMFEENDHFEGKECTVIIHEPVETKGLDRKQQSELPDVVYEIIQKPLREYEPQNYLK